MTYGSLTLPVQPLLLRYKIMPQVDMLFNQLKKRNMDPVFIRAPGPEVHRQHANHQASEPDQQHQNHEATKDHLNALAMLSMEKKLVRDIPDFKKKVIERFATQKERRAKFFFFYFYK